MDEKQFRAIMDAVLSVGMRVEELRLDLRRVEQVMDARWQILYDAIQDESVKAEIDSLPTAIDMPDDMRKFFPDAD